MKPPQGAPSIVVAEARRAELPQTLRDEIGNEEILFIAQEGRWVSRAGAVGGIVVGVLLVLAAAVALALRGVPGVTIEMPFYEGPASGPEGEFALAVAAGASMVAGVGLLAATPIVRRMRGGLFVGTPSRILRAGRLGVRVGRWRDFESATLGADGTIDITPFPAGPSTPSAVRSLVEIPGAASIHAQIESLLRAPQKAPAPGSLAARAAEPLGDFTFHATHAPAAPGRFAGAAIAAAGLLLAVFWGASLSSSNTVTVSSNGGPERAVGAGDFEAWIPVLIGAGAAAVGVAWFVLRSPRKLRTEFLATDEKLVARSESGETREYEWRLFTGELRRRSGRHGEELHFPLRSVVRSGRGRESQEVLAMVGVSNADEVEKHVRHRIP